MNISSIQIPEAAISRAKEFVDQTIDYTFTALETEVLDLFFTNTDHRVFFVHGLPANMTATLFAIYSRLKNPRGIRGTFVDSFLAQVLASQTEECRDDYNGDAVAFLKANGIKTIDQLSNHSADARIVIDCFFKGLHEVGYLEQLTDSDKMKAFLNTWLEKYGHNSIARPATVYFCCEGISILAAKSLEWSRPGVGFIELSTRYVDMNGAGVYPFGAELLAMGVDTATIVAAEQLVQDSFAAYRGLQGKDFDGPFPSFFRERFSNLIPADQMERGVMGETCDVLGNLLPCSTLTSVGVSTSGEAFPGLIKHLRLDNTPENHALADAIIAEAKKIGADQFLRHMDLTAWDHASWEYLPGDIGQKSSILSSMETIATIHPLTDNSFISIDRTTYDKLPREFELVTASFVDEMSFRGWRDLQRMGFCTHKRSLVNPENGFYHYDKSALNCLSTRFKRISEANMEVFQAMLKAGVPPHLAQYPMAMGNLVKFLIGANLRQWEFCFFQRTKPTVNHEVRQIFLKFNEQLSQRYRWWDDLTRTDRTPAYVCARAGEIPLQ